MWKCCGVWGLVLTTFNANNKLTSNVPSCPDCTIGDHVHIAPGVTLSGDVSVGACSHLGTGATVIQGVSIGSGCLVAAGAVVTKDIADGEKVRGVPARKFA